MNLCWLDGDMEWDMSLIWRQNPIDKWDHSREIYILDPRNLLPGPSGGEDQETCMQIYLGW